jgi:hypothetical protein
MKTLTNEASEGRDAQRETRWVVLTSSNSVVAEAATKEEAEAKAVKPGLRVSQGWTEGGYRVFVGATKVMVANDFSEGPSWKVKANLWLPTYGLATSTAKELCNL